MNHRDSPFHWLASKHLFSQDFACCRISLPATREQGRFRGARPQSAWQVGPRASGHDAVRGPWDSSVSIQLDGLTLNTLGHRKT